jgi:uncharacterized protein YbjT (DUF2867 family)
MNYSTTSNGKSIYQTSPCQSAATKMSIRILVTGATGKQGGSLINSLLSSPSATSLNIFAVTRNASSPASLALAARKITLIEGDIATSSASIFSKVNDVTKGQPLDAAFLVTVPTPPKPFGPKPPSEEEQALPFIDAAAASGVKHLVFTSVDRGVNSDTDPTVIPHFAAKYRIEEYLKKKSKDSTLPGGGNPTWTILRPVAFMDNFTNDFMGRTFASMWGSLGSKPLQLIATSDIGKFAARAVLDPTKYAGKAIPLAGDDLTLEGGKKVFKETLGTDMPVGYGFIGGLVKYMVTEVGVMFNWFATDGYTADVAWCRSEGALSFGEWLKTESQFKVTK